MLDPAGRWAARLEQVPQHVGLGILANLRDGICFAISMPYGKQPPLQEPCRLLERVLQCVECSTETALERGRKIADPGTVSSGLFAIR